MGISKTELFNADQNELAQIAKTLAHPARIAILQFLAKQNTCICNDIVEEIGLAQATISQHLKELKQAGLVQGNIEGAGICYCINHDVWTNYKGKLNQFFDTIQPIEKGKCC